MKKIKNYNEFIKEEAAPKKGAIKLAKDKEKDKKDKKKESDKPYEINQDIDMNNPSSATFVAIQNMLNQ